jgi:ribosome-binding protein aMBF1 (putative translation factor)
MYIELRTSHTLHKKPCRIGPELRRIARKSGKAKFLSCGELAEKVGSHRDHIGRVERDEIDSPHITTICKLVKALDVDLRELHADDSLYTNRLRRGA